MNFLSDSRDSWMALVQTSGEIGDDGPMARFVPVEELFSGRHFDREIVVLCVRWYQSYKLSYRDLVAMMGERSITMAHTTILRWVQHYSPEFQKRWQRFARTVGGSWRMDETYIRVKGEWMYLYRAVDKAGQTVDFFLSRQRDVNAAKAFLRKALKGQRLPTKITLDAYAASHRALSDLKQSGELPSRVLVRTSKYLNNLIEQDHRRRTTTLDIYAHGRKHNFLLHSCTRSFCFRLPRLRAPMATELEMWCPPRSPIQN
jgi:transposase-like protein